MTTVLKKLGDDWHNSHPYVELIQSLIPSCAHLLDIERLLTEIYVDEHYDFKSLKLSQGTETIYDDEIEEAEMKKGQLEEEMKKESERFQKLLEKFKEQEAPDSTTEEEKEEEKEEEEEKDDDVTVNQKKKSIQKGCRRTLKAEELRKKQQVKAIKSSMASSQQMMMEMRDEIDTLEKKITYYKHYQSAQASYLKGKRDAKTAYMKSKDVQALIVSLADVIGYYKKMMRRYVPAEACCGEENGLCKSHLLPLYRARNPNSGFRDTFKCEVSPV
jgi:hypothetical protein